MEETLLSFLRQSIKPARMANLGMPFIVLLIMSMLIVPLPSLALDMLFTVNILIGLIIIMVSVNVSKPLEFSSFPSILLLATMLRLSLNVASTRVVLVNGHQGPGAAGNVIESFGEFVIGGNYVVGFIIFVILMIINFIVVTKGAGRVSEVIARFTLDALPGKQMAIDADLNAGVIDQEAAKRRREEVSQESDFFGSMDGASKFVRGDAIAGILILLINIIGGLAIGISQHNLSFAQAGEIYVLLTIGDGLVAQIPSLLLSLSTAIIVTRVTTSESTSAQAGNQLASPAALSIASGILIFLGCIPGMPHFIFLSMGGVLALISYLLSKSKKNAAMMETSLQEAAPEEDKTQESEELDWSHIEPVDQVGLEIGYGLIPLIDQDSGGTLLSRVRGIRKKLSSEIGFLVNPIRIRDNLEIGPNDYNIVLNGTIRGQGRVFIGKELAINPGQITIPLEGEKTLEPAFGLDAYWIDRTHSDFAKTAGYTVVDPATAIATHMNSILKNNADQLLGHNETQQLLDLVSERSPKLIEDLVPGKLSVSTVTQVLKNLLQEGVSIRDNRSIFDSLLSESGKTKDAVELTSLVRPHLGRSIVQDIVNAGESLPIITLEQSLEQLLNNALQESSQSREAFLEPKLIDALVDAIAGEKFGVEEQGQPAVLVVSPTIRPWLSRITRQRLGNLSVLAYTEIPEDQEIKVVGKVGIQTNQAHGVAA
ncbi:MAG TPA: flagellar biosynthesis protein FlhA [Gammaproteobacteria bacterium]|nr:flagellar biosynthesis protein FlhA [Gammaproteobacteria bacterium]|tara:strand:+ start:11090 stop:13219 length:2130 start_codon:yes stop_codon:yes gene_type:complete